LPDDALKCGGNLGEPLCDAGFEVSYRILTLGVARA
jgi:hypothetical protein